MRLQFLRDYRGRSTGEAFYRADSVGDFAEADGRALLAEGVAVPAAAGARLTGPDKDADLPCRTEIIKARDEAYFQGRQRGMWR